ncbi:hypothetical protein ANRL3_02180 [Anaerolineae bacterium]|nr:hypothetical protein ANRL3_02180 [Anaerolineae bacterium]
MRRVRKRIVSVASGNDELPRENSVVPMEDVVVGRENGRVRNGIVEVPIEAIACSNEIVESFLWNDPYQTPNAEPANGNNLVRRLGGIV